MSDADMADENRVTHLAPDWRLLGIARRFVVEQREHLGADGAHNPAFCRHLFDELASYVDEVGAILANDAKAAATMVATDDAPYGNVGRLVGILG